jgi:aryl carrier-like protein
MNTAELRDTLLRRLPEYMVPSYFLLLDEFPLTSNRKIDRKALPDPEWSSAIRSKDYVAPQTASEKLLAAIWSEVLGIEQIGVNDSLLELGADSLKMFQIAARAGRKGLRVTAKQLMKLRTIAAIAGDLGGQPGEKEMNVVGPVVRVSREKYRVPVAEIQ